MRFAIVLSFLLLASCAMTDQQIDDLSRSIGAAAQTGAQVAAPSMGVEGTAGAGLAGAIGTAVTIGIGLILRKVRKKPGA